MLEGTNCDDGPACNAEMHLMQMDLRGDLRSPIAFERHTFKCSVCPQLSERLVFSRPSLSDLPIAARTRYPLDLETDQRCRSIASAITREAQGAAVEAGAHVSGMPLAGAAFVGPPKAVSSTSCRVPHLEPFQNARL